MYFVYKLTCLVNGKSYIGVTGNINGRMAGHRYEANHGSSCPIHCAIQKYSWDSFELTVLYESPTPEAKLALSTSHKGKQFDKEHKANLKAAWTSERRERMREHMTGNTFGSKQEVN